MSNVFNDPNALLANACVGLKSLALVLGYLMVASNLDVAVEER
jgi:hypothetical protein